jgi:hypothetical protein
MSARPPGHLPNSHDVITFESVASQSNCKNNQKQKYVQVMHVGPVMTYMWWTCFGKAMMFRSRLYIYYYVKGSSLGFGSEVCV